MKNIKTANCDKKKKTTMIFTNQIPTLKTYYLYSNIKTVVLVVLQQIN